ncbi:sensor histidine kinase [Nocardia sp. alder85J]|uniref:sensor histidine kinase n=1 Tax=Nocardia sp. alder85J TaxID=2862949 RepID=UPI001CD57B4E|nr:HAMP domain-containing sensor histidine kinase [Nocardia sp. alder85J]MCX4094059.1 HAMP domain-containing sensor histidine kinase [Nocardia sp. alder85J]
MSSADRRAALVAAGCGLVATLLATAAALLGELWAGLAVAAAGGGGLAAGLWLILRRWTRRHQAALASLRRRSDREDRLIGDLGHELRTPVTTLSTSVQVLSNHEAEIPDRPRRALRLARAEIDHLRRLLDDLLTLARAEAGVHQIEARPVALRDLITGLLTARQLPPRLLAPGPDVTVAARPAELERVLTNLLDNAERHGGGLAGIGLARDGSEAVLTVDDDGPGVPAADRQRIFERFVTGRRSRRGTGIGLALVAETITAHGGQVDCDARPGGGARFTVRLPAVTDLTPPGIVT